MIDENDPRLTALLLDELDDDSAAEIQAAIDSSMELQEYVDGLRTTIGTLHESSKLIFANDAEMSDEQIQTIEKRANQSVNLPTVDRRGVWRRFAMAALVLYAVGISFVALRKPTLSPQQLSKLNLDSVESRDQDKDRFRRMAPQSPIGEPDDVTRLGLQDVPDVSSPAPNDAVGDQGGADVQLGFDGISGLPNDNISLEIEASTTIVSGDNEGDDRVREVESESADSGSLRYVPELDQIILRGSKNDVRRVQEVIEEIRQGNSGEREALSTLGRSTGAEATEAPVNPNADRGLDSAELQSRIEDFRSARGRQTDHSPFEGEEQPTSAGREDGKPGIAIVVPDPAAAPETEDNGDVTPARPLSLELTEITDSLQSENEPDLRADKFAIDAEESNGQQGQSQGRESNQASANGRLSESLSNLKERRLKLGRELHFEQDFSEQDRRELSRSLNELTRSSNRLESNLAPAEEAERTVTESTEVISDAQKELDEKSEVLARGNNLVELRKQIESLEKKVGEAKQRRKRQRIKTWKPASAKANRARLSVGHHDDLTLAARDTYVRIDGFRARVFFDLYYYNDRGQQLEGQFLLRLPTDASLHYFAFGPTDLPGPSAPPATGKPGEAREHQTAAEESIIALRQSTAESGTDLGRRAADPDFMADAKTTFASVKPARVVPRQKAALAYEETVRRRVDPALVEWAGPGIFQTKVFPLLPNRLHRIVVGYDVNLVDTEDGLSFQLDLPEDEAGGRVELDIAAAAGTSVDVKPNTDPFISGSRAYYRYENAVPRDYTVTVTGDRPIILQSQQTVGEDYFALQLPAELPSDPAAIETERAVFMLDTSYSDRPASFSKRLKLLEQILSKNRSSIKQFAVLLFNVEQRWWREEFVVNNDESVAEFLKLADSLVLEGATDLHAALKAATQISWNNLDESKALPNLFLLSDGTATWGRTDLAALADALTHQDRALGGGSLFTYHLAGHTSDRSVLQWLASSAGGAVFDVPEEAGWDDVAVAHQSRPWQIESIRGKGARDILVQGAGRSVYPGQRLSIAGKGKLRGPLTIEFSRGKESKMLRFDPEVKIASPAASRLYGQFAVERLEPHEAELQEVTVAFARYFRVPGRTCSMVMLESQQDYERFGVSTLPSDDQMVVASTSIDQTLVELEQHLRDVRQNPLEQFSKWVHSLSESSLVHPPTALRLAIRRLPQDSFAFNMQTLNCKSWKTRHADDEFLQAIRLDDPAFAPIMQEAERRRLKFGTDDAIKVASTMIEAKPSDPDTLRSVAFRAIEWNRNDQAAPLLWRLAQARPYQPQCLLLLGRSLAQSGDTDAALVCFDLVCHGNWNQRWASGAKSIAQVELLHLLERVDQGKAKSAIESYARARLRQLRRQWSEEGLDLAIVMHWNTDRTDVDLHVTEPGGEVCNYQHKETKSGGRISQDITEGLGPEMYTTKTASDGSYRVEAKYYNSDSNRTKTPSEALVTIFESLGRPDGKTSNRTITLTGKGEMQAVTNVEISHGTE